MITPEPEHRVVDGILAHLGVAGEPTREKGSAACTYMTAVFEARYHYWNNYAFMGESWQTDEDPYVRCWRHPSYWLSSRALWRAWVRSPGG